MQGQDNIYLRHERIQGQRTLIDAVHIGIAADLPPVAIIAQTIDYGTASEPMRMPGAIDIQFNSPAESITGHTRPKELLTARQLKRYAAAMSHAAAVLDQWETRGHLPSVLEGVRS